ncbi:MAG TPA: hypothetical protein VFZ27_07650 [Terriglobia bacterium]|nr:hypothetical protein [Terriglobia bacterium]
MIHNSAMENPFQFGRELGANELVDREQEIAEVIGTIRQAGKLFLIGPRRYGKTSVLKAAADRLSSEGAVVLRYDAEAYPSLDLLIASVISGAAKHLKGGVERAGDAVRRYFGKLRPEVNFSITDREWNVSLRVADAAGGARHIGLLVDMLDGLEQLARAQPEDRPVGLMIDEFQKVVDLGGTEAEAQIRAAIQRHKRTGYIFAGSKTRLLTAMTLDAARPFYRLGQLRFVGPVPRDDFGKFLRKGFNRSQFIASAENAEEAVELILDLADEVPYNVQLLAHACWEQLRAGKTSKERALTSAVVERSLDRVVRQYDPFYTQLWNGVTAIQQKTLLAVITEHGVNLQSTKVAQALGKGPSTIRRSLLSLTAREILREEELEGKVRMRFEDPFFAQWIARFTAHP